MTFESVNVTTLGSVFNENFGKEIVEYEWWKFLGVSFGISILGGLALIVLFYLLLCILGFTCLGIRAGSSAACCHSSIGDVEADSCFSCCQSLGAGGKACCFSSFLFFIGFFTAGTLLVLAKVHHDGGNSNSTMIANVSVADLAMSTTVFFLNNSMVDSL